MTIGRFSDIISLEGFGTVKTKEKILELLIDRQGRYFSGEEIAHILSISRAAVWKAVKRLQSEGVAIDAVTNRGYSLTETADFISVRGIRERLRPELEKSEISVLPVASSTNALLEERAREGAAEWTLLLAEEQLSGRGRNQRPFYSPKDTGIYMSLLLRPENYTADQAVRITIMAAVAVCEAIEVISGEETAIKWVNDIFLKGKKICGILTEGVVSIENGRLDHVILGIGINLYEPKEGFPSELRPLAGAVFSQKRKDTKVCLVASILNRFYGFYTDPFSTDYLVRYRSRSCVIGRRVRLVSGDRTSDVLVSGIDDRGYLTVRYLDGTEESCCSGEISLRVSDECFTDGKP